MNRFYYPPGQVGNENGRSDPTFMRKYGEEALQKDTGKWIDSCVWHGKAHTWDKIRWLIAEVRAVLATSATHEVDADLLGSGRRYRAGGRSSSRVYSPPKTRSRRTRSAARASS